MTAEASTNSTNSNSNSNSNSSSSSSRNVFEKKKGADEGGDGGDGSSSSNPCWNGFSCPVFLRKYTNENLRSRHQEQQQQQQQQQQRATATAKAYSNGIGNGNGATTAASFRRAGGIEQCITRERRQRDAKSRKRAYYDSAAKRKTCSERETFKTKRPRVPHRDAKRGPTDTRSKGRASTKRQTMPVGTLYTFLDQLVGCLFEQPRMATYCPVKSAFYLDSPTPGTLRGRTVGREGTEDSCFHFALTPAIDDRVTRLQLGVGALFEGIRIERRTIIDRRWMVAWKSMGLWHETQWNLKPRPMPMPMPIPD
ncbi:hypothetical protein M0802_005042 [Mischocyttarus mexicanus]|nr:hypothetical protein M0802_005042 [Mischocyttarus mexicanus]